MRQADGLFPVQQSATDWRQEVSQVHLAALQDLERFAHRQGIMVYQYRCRLVPWQYGMHRFVRETGIWGFAGRRQGRRFAYVGYCGGADKRLAELALAHELGHCLQMQLADLYIDYKMAPTPEAWVKCWHQEVDAWHRGLEVLGDLGRPLTPYEADYVAACLGSYAQVETTGVADQDDIWSLLASA